MSKETLIQKGFIVEADPTKVTVPVAFFSLERWLKKALSKIGVTYADCCIRTTNGSTAQPKSIRLSADGTKIEYYDPADFTWKDAGFTHP